MAAAEPPRRSSDLVLLVTGGILAVAILLSAYRLAQAMRERQIPAPPVRIAPPEPSASAPAASPGVALAPAGDGRLMLAGRDGHVFLLALRSEDGGAPEVVLERVYRLRQDPGRHLEEPDRRSITGWYLDDLGSQKAAAVKAMKADFEDRLKTVGGTVEEIDALTAIAHALAEAGELPFLSALLVHDSYVARRAGALALGRRGWRRATPALIEVARRGDNRSRALAGDVLAGLTGLDAPDGTAGQAWTDAVAAWEAWWNEQGSSGDGGVPPPR